MLCTVVPKLLEIARQDQDRTVVMSAVDSLHELLERLGAAVLQVTNTTDAILQGMKDIFTHKVGRGGFLFFLFKLMMGSSYVDGGSFFFFCVLDHQ